MTASGSYIPTRSTPVNAAFAPDQDSYDRAELIIDAYRQAAAGRHQGAVMLGEEMIDEALKEARPGRRRSRPGRGRTRTTGLDREKGQLRS